MEPSWPEFPGWLPGLSAIRKLAGNGVVGSSSVPPDWSAQELESPFRQASLPEVQRSLPIGGWCHPLRRSGIMVTRNHSASKRGQRRSWCGRRDLNPHRPCGPTDFRTHLRLSPPLLSSAGFGVWTIPSPCPDFAPGVRCCPSSLYTFPAISGRAWLGIAMLQGSPILSSSASSVSRRALKFFTQVRCVCRFRHARTISKVARNND